MAAARRRGVAPGGRAGSDRRRTRTSSRAAPKWKPLIVVRWTQTRAPATSGWAIRVNVDALYPRPAAKIVP